MTATSRLGLQLWPAGITQADVPANDNALQLDATMNLSVVSATTTAQPGSPTAGQVYILPASPTGTNWAGQATGTIAIYTTAWYFFAPKAGYTARVADTGQLLIYTSAWVNVETLHGSKGTAIASATTTDIGAATGDFVHITGTTTITGLGTAKAGICRIIVFDGVLTFTHNATSLILPGGSNITTSANDCALMVSEGSGNWRCVGYFKANGQAVASGGGSSIVNGSQYVVDTSSTADSDPGNGYLKFNNATQASATVIYVDDLTEDGVDSTALWAGLLAGGFLRIQSSTNQDTWQLWKISSITDASGYVKLGVSLMADGGAFSDEDPVFVTFGNGATSNSTWTTARKTSAQTRSSTTTLADDSQLTFALSGSTNYHIRGKIFLGTANATMDYKWALAYSSTITTDISRVAYGDAGGSGGTDYEAVLVSSGLTNSGAVTRAAATSGPACINIDMVFTTNGAGTFSFQWAQNTSDAGNLTVYAGSYLEYASMS